MHNSYRLGKRQSSLQSVIRVMIEFLLIFSKANFMEVPKIHIIHEICSPQGKLPTVYLTLEWHIHMLWLKLNGSFTCLCNVGLYLNGF